MLLADQLCFFNSTFFFTGNARESSVLSSIYIYEVHGTKYNININSLVLVCTKHGMHSFLPNAPLLILTDTLTHTHIPKYTRYDVLLDRLYGCECRQATTNTKKNSHSQKHTHTHRTKPISLGCQRDKGHIPTYMYNVDMSMRRNMYILCMQHVSYILFRLLFVCKPKNAGCSLFSIVMLIV